MQIDDVSRPGLHQDDEKTGRSRRCKRTRPFLGHPRIVLSADFRQRALYAHHLSYYGGHFGLAKTFARLALQYCWPRQRSNVRPFLARCTFCMANTQFSKPWRWLGFPIGTLFEIVAADILGPLIPTARRRTYILVLIDHHTRWVELIALPEPTAELVAEDIFEQWISRLATMRALLTDNGRQFTARVLQQLTDVCGIKHIYSPPYNSRGNSVVDSYMSTLKPTLKSCMQAFQTDRDVVLQASALAYSASSHTVTGHTSSVLVTAQEVVLPLSREWHEPVLCPLGVIWLEALWRCRLKVIKPHEIAADENARAQTFETSRLRPGNHITLRLSKADRQAEGTFSPLFNGPYVIVNVKPAGVTADIRCLATGHMPTVNRCRLKFLEATPQACTSYKAPAAGRIPLAASFLAKGRGGTDADVPTQRASHAPHRQRSKGVRLLSSVSGSASKLKLFFSADSRLRTESDTPDLVFFSRAQGGLSNSTATVASAATRAADPRRSSRRASAWHWSLVSPTANREATALQCSSADPAPHPAAAEEEQPIASSGEKTGEGASPRTAVLSAVALSRLRMRPSFMQWPDPRAFGQYLRTLAHPSLRASEESPETARHLAPSHLDRARLACARWESQRISSRWRTESSFFCSASDAPCVFSETTCGVGVSGR